MPENPSAIKSSQVRWSLASRPSVLLAVPMGAQYDEGCGNNYFGEGGGLEAVSALVSVLVVEKSLAARGRRRSLCRATAPDR